MKTPSSTPMSDEQEDELDSIIAYINGCTRKPDGTLFLAQADYLKNLIDHHTKEAVDKKLVDLQESIKYMGLCESDSDKMLIWVKNHRWSLIAPKGKDMAAPVQERGGE